MSKKWLILYVIILIYLPISIDTTVLYVASPRLSFELGVSGNELLWIIDIYSLMMAGLLLPMGALGDRLGYKQLALYGTTLFALASLMAAMANNAIQLIIARAVLAIGAAMILPATLSAVRHTFTNERERGIALGIWAAVGTSGAAMGPLVAGILLEHFYWGSVFLINLPIIAIVLPATWFIIPQQPQRYSQPWQLSQTLMLITTILMLVYAAKSGLHGSNGGLTLVATLFGTILLIYFVRNQINSPAPMLDLSLFRNRELTIGIIMSITALMTLVGFELLITQEMQFVYGRTPLQAGLFMLPLMLAAGACGPFAGWLIAKLCIRRVASIGMGLCSLSFLGLSMTDFVNQPLFVCCWMVLLGTSIEASLLASTAAIMSSVTPEKAGAAGAIEGMAFELGAGLGITLFGLLLTSSYTASMVLPLDLPDKLAVQALASISDAMLVAENLEAPAGEKLRQLAQSAFVVAHNRVLLAASSALALLSLVVWYLMPDKKIS